MPGTFVSRPTGWVFQGLTFALAIVIFVSCFAGKNVPVGWMVVDCLFGAYNVYFLTRPDVPRAFKADGAAPTGTDDRGEVGGGHTRLSDRH